MSLSVSSQVSPSSAILPLSGRTPTAPRRPTTPTSSPCGPRAARRPERVADKLGHTGPVDDLINQLAVTPSLELNTVQLVATASSDDEAVLLVNTFAEETLAYLDQLNQTAEDEAQGAVDELDAQILALNDQITAAGGETAPAATALVEQRTGLRTSAARRRPRPTAAWPSGHRCAPPRRPSR